MVFSDRDVTKRCVHNGVVPSCDVAQENTCNDNFSEWNILKESAHVRIFLDEVTEMFLERVHRTGILSNKDVPKESELIW